VEVSEYRAAKSSPMEDENKLEFGMWYKANGVSSFIAQHCIWLRIQLDSFYELCHGIDAHLWVK
jgi:hypothetical protein